MEGKEAAAFFGAAGLKGAVHELQEKWRCALA